MPVQRRFQSTFPQGRSAEDADPEDDLREAIGDPIPERFPMVRFLVSLCALLVPVTLASMPPAQPASPPPASLYQLESSWRDDAGRSVKLADLRGKARVLAMFFSHCDNVCPMLTGQLKTVEREMPARLRERTGFVLVTLDTESDDPAALSDYRKRMGLAPSVWTLLRGGPDDTRELANLLGVTYKPKGKDGQIDHDGLIVILDKNGVVVEKTSGITDRKAFLKALEKAAK